MELENSFLYMYIHKYGHNSNERINCLITNEGFKYFLFQLIYHDVYICNGLNSKNLKLTVTFCAPRISFLIPFEACQWEG